MASLERTVMSFYMARKQGPASSGAACGHELSVTKPFRNPLREAAPPLTGPLLTGPLVAGHPATALTCR